MAESSPVPTRRYHMTARAEAARENGERVLAGARDLFRERLFDQVTLDDVARRAGVTVRTIVRRFGSKEQLYIAIAAERGREIRAERDQASAGDISGAVRTLVRSYETHGDEVLHLLAQEPRAEAIALGVQAGREYHHAWVERVFSPLLPRLPEAQRNRRLAQLIAVTDVYMWKVLRRDLGLSRPAVEGSIQGLVEKIIAARLPAD